MNTDPIADLLTRIRNASDAKHPTVKVPASKSKKQILALLTDEGFVAGYEERDNEDGKPEFKIALRFDNKGLPVIREIKRLSRPGKRVYVGREEIPRNRGGLGMVIVSTSKGMLSDQKARLEGIGGELICSVF